MTKAPLVWFGGVATAIVTAVAVTFANLYGGQVAGVGRPPVRHGLPITLLHVSAKPPGDDESFVFPRPLDLSPAQLTAFNSSGGTGWGGKNSDYLWAWSHGGAALDEVAITLVLQGNRNGLVRISDMQLAEQCGKPLTGTLFYSPNSGEGPVPQIGFDLDQVHPIARKAIDQGLGASYFASKTITLGYGEQQQIMVTATTRRHNCEFRLDMTVLDGTTPVHQLIGNGPQPFRVTADIGVNGMGAGSQTFSAYQRAFAGGLASLPCTRTGRWVEVNPKTYPKHSAASATSPGRC